MNAATQTADVAAKPPLLAQLRSRERLPLLIGGAALVALLIAVFLWSRAPDYKVLYSNLSDRDGGAIITSLQQMNVPYKFAEGGGAILVPAEQVHDVRLRLASQGLPKGGLVGFELMDNQKFGISQFAEQVNYQRALEGELARSVESLSAVQAARVHLAIPKPSVFVREQQKPSASVLVTLYPGRVLDDAQVSAIVHMVASSVPELPVKNVTVLDQNGNLLSAQSGNALGLDASQLKYVRELEQSYARRIEAILNPIVGPGNVHAQVTADVDFNQVEQTSENYKPNSGDQAVRSQQSSEASQIGANAAGGVPGALSNQPPGQATAPITQPQQQQLAQQGAATPGAASAPQGPRSDRKDATTNYEIDRTIRHVQQATGGLKRLSAAIVVNYRPGTDAKGKPAMVALTQAQLDQIQNLSKEAIGFSGQRGDTINIVNSAFTVEEDPEANLPWWRQRQNIELAKQVGKWVLIGLIGLYLWFGVIRPAIRKHLTPPPPAEPTLAGAGGSGGAAGADGADGESADGEGGKRGEISAYERNLQYARQVARQDPKIVATVVKAWVGGGDERG
ncbi:flagellar basal-body MS-ring/collar protein FliF [Pandoraea sp. ISTKB]|uniref:flagellar basal-body MS-ring/collar protein FliF n=1 Tax=Pandoraea sp. ISTKB TaxID=1586708 RepID=UPI000846595B|nr:flagellar basal-body MS-ring/collar protein FliF [Pandoraea sp. ISTKB]ODP31172.1 flagellar M-ring protein FliF [Pandoraea sp. ISTKB]